MRVKDTVYRADGLPAAGSLLISWPAFKSAGVGWDYVDTAIARVAKVSEAASMDPAGSQVVNQHAGGSLEVPGSERKNPILRDFQAMLVEAHLLALPVVDPQDAVAALWYRIYAPSACGA